MGGNPLGEIDSATFGGLASLERLWINGCALTSLPSGLFDGLGALQHLYLHSNGLLSALPEGIFGGDEGPGAVQVLDLRENALVAAPSTVGLNALHTLNLSGNRLSSLSAGLFPADLQYLYLADNLLGSFQYGVPPGVFDGLGELRTLTLGDNDLSTLPAGLFDDLRALTVLSLEGNSRLECVPSTAMSSSLLASKTLLPAGFEKDGGACTCPAGLEMCEVCVDGGDGYVCVGCDSEWEACQTNRECRECRIQATGEEEQEEYEACVSRHASYSNTTCSAVSAEACCLNELSTNDCLDNDFFVAHAECVVKALSDEACTTLRCASEPAVLSAVTPTSGAAAGGRSAYNASAANGGITVAAFILTGISISTELFWV